VNEFKDRVAVITGGGAGIGRAMGLTFAGKGMHIAIADVDPAAAEATAGEIRALGVRALTSNVDVTDRAAMGAFADRVYAEFGRCDILCNNAGVSTFRPAQEMSDADWDWVVGVDLLGVLYGIQAFLPRMLQQGTGGHIVNTSSIAGMVPLATISSYQAAKYAVVGLSESLALELAEQNIGVSVLCPGLVKTGIANSGRNRPSQFGGPEPVTERVQAGIDATGYDPLDVAKLVLRCVEANQLYVFTHPEWKELIAARRDRILAAYDWAAAGA
jgi:NAD(P)-dependent dehydrogenase (short-subunit alcohol dehydrogenase family)